MWKRNLKKAKRRGRPSYRLAPTSKALAPGTWSLQRKLPLPYPQWKVIRLNGKSPSSQAGFLAGNMKEAEFLSLTVPPL
jgi:hypothetical protein